MVGGDSPQLGLYNISQSFLSFCKLLKECFILLFLHNNNNNSIYIERKGSTIALIYINRERKRLIPAKVQDSRAKRHDYGPQTQSFFVFCLTKLVREGW